jgi:hypothetical protein
MGGKFAYSAEIGDNMKFVYKELSEIVEGFKLERTYMKVIRKE